METRELTSEEWPDFFDRFSRLHAGQWASVVTMGVDVGAQVNANEMKLLGVTAEDRGIEIAVGNSPQSHLSHVIACPTHVRIAEWNDGYSAAVQFETADGQVTLLRVGPQDKIRPVDLITDDIHRAAKQSRC